MIKSDYENVTHHNASDFQRSDRPYIEIGFDCTCSSIHRLHFHNHFHLMNKRKNATFLMNFRTLNLFPVPSLNGFELNTRVRLVWDL